MMCCADGPCFFVFGNIRLGYIRVLRFRTTILPTNGDRVPDLSQPEKDRIVFLWAERKRGLTPAERTEFWGLLFRKLVRTILPDEFSDPRARHDLVNDFILNKVILNAATTKAGPLVSANVLHKYLRKYASSQLKNAAAKLKREGKPINDKAEFQLQQDIGTIAEDDPVSHLEDSVVIEQIFAGEESDQDSNSPAVEEDCAEPPEVAYANRLNIETVKSSADQFIESLAEWEKAYLSRHTCQEKKDRTPIDALAIELHLGSSYHYKAKQLGITGSKQGFFHGYEKTRIGAWMTSLGVKIELDAYQKMRALLAILCAELLGKTTEGSA